jgi:hypothetical protein
MPAATPASLRGPASHSNAVGQTRLTYNVEPEWLFEDFHPPTRDALPPVTNRYGQVPFYERSAITNRYKTASNNFADELCRHACHLLSPPYYYYSDTVLTFDEYIELAQALRNARGDQIGTATEFRELREWLITEIQGRWEAMALSARYEKADVGHQRWYDSMVRVKEVLNGEVWVVEEQDYQSFADTY